MANRADFIKALKSYNYQLKDRAAHDQHVAALWQALKPEQRDAAQKEEYRARVYTAGYEAGQRIACGEADKRIVAALLRVADYMDLWAVEPEAEPQDSMEALAVEVLGLVRDVRYGEQP